MLAFKGFFLCIFVHWKARNDGDEAKRNRGYFLPSQIMSEVHKDKQLYILLYGKPTNMIFVCSYKNL